MCNSSMSSSGLSVTPIFKANSETTYHWESHYQFVPPVPSSFASDSRTGSVAGRTYGILSRLRARIYVWISTGCVAEKHFCLGRNKNEY